MSLRIGLDIGSTTVKMVILNEKDEIIHSKYKRHFSEIEESVRDIIKTAYKELRLENPKVHIMATGSAGLFLEEYMQFHFNTEESMMRKYNYELIEEHKKLHDDLKEKVTGYIELYFLGNYSFIEELEEVVQEWIYEHILEEDRKYKEFFKNKHITF